MTARELYEYTLIELNKLEAPSLLLEDYNYFINKAVQQYINLVYAKHEIDQQSTDDIRVLKASTIQVPLKMSKTGLSDSTWADLVSNGPIQDATYYVDLPSDYLHLRNCIVEYTVSTSKFKCYNLNDKVYFAAKYLNSDLYTQILNNAYLCPTYKRPYYYLTNLNPGDTVNKVDNKVVKTVTELPTNSEIDTPIMDYNNGSSDKGSVGTHGTNYSEGRYDDSNLVDSETSAGDRLANPSRVRLELRFGSDDTVFRPTHVYIDYIKSPMYIRLTQDQVKSTLDYSQVLEFPDYVCFEIVNIFTRLIMENASDPRLQTNMPINNTIANPAIQQTQK